VLLPRFPPTPIKLSETSNLTLMPILQLSLILQVDILFFFFAIRGGAYIAGNKGGAFTSQELPEVLKRGWVAVSIDYRLLPGVVLQDVVEDVQDAYA